ncbi:thioesterase family protein [Desulfosarcina sp.]|uniref:acyl-CoA thioesterase n=1 Tax=Desulfosarcina sp. TaxID=2027861 RepID=UPI0029A1E5B1|nr:thioesterase family protein [Desulfosarcina sp.]MDX2455493.1 thioesterase family protein [Desulfosarcina sp.]
MKSTTEITIRNYHIDHFGHVNHARYVELLEEARWRYLEENDLLESIHRVGAFHVVVKIAVQYRQGARIGDVLQIETQIDSRSKHSFCVGQTAYIKASGKAAVEATITNVFVDGKGHPRPIETDVLSIWPDLAAAVQLETGFEDRPR